MKIKLIVKVYAVLVLCLIALSQICTGQQRSTQAVSGFSDSDEELMTLRENVADQLHLYREVMEHIGTISESFSFGYTTPDEALKRVLVLRHAYNSESEPLRPEVEEFNRLINRMFSRLENYFIHFKSSFREDPYLNMKLAEKKFYVNQEAERLLHTYLQ